MVVDPYSITLWNGSGIRIPDPDPKNERKNIVLVNLFQFNNNKDLFWIRIRIGSKFNYFVDTDPNYRGISFDKLAIGRLMCLENFPNLR
jgi:hypothetical protein